MRAIFASRPSVELVIFFGLESPTLERYLSSFYLIRHEPMRKSTTSLVNQASGTLSHWFMPYKVERGKSSFQCGTKRIQGKARQGKARQSSQKAKVKAKNSWVPTATVFFFFLVIGLCLFFLLNIYVSWYIYYYTDTTNFTIPSQLLTCANALKHHTYSALVSRAFFFFQVLSSNYSAKWHCSYNS